MPQLHFCTHKILRRTSRIAAALLAAAAASSAETISLTPEGTLTVIESAAPLGDPLRYLSGGDGLTGLAGAWPIADTPAAAAGAIDHKWLQGNSAQPVVWISAVPISLVFVVPGIDHGPAPQESLEFVLQGSNDGASWTGGTITSIYRDGFDTANTAAGHSDDYTSLWQFSAGFQMFRAVAGDHLDPHFGSSDYEIDGLAPAAPEPASLALATLGLLTASLLKRRLRGPR